MFLERLTCIVKLLMQAVVTVISSYALPSGGHMRNGRSAAELLGSISKRSSLQYCRQIKTKFITFSVLEMPSSGSYCLVTLHYEKGLFQNAVFQGVLGTCVKAPEKANAPRTLRSWEHLIHTTALVQRTQHIKSKYIYGILLIKLTIKIFQKICKLPFNIICILSSNLDEIILYSQLLCHLIAVLIYVIKIF